MGGKGKKQDLKQQAYSRLTKQIAFGESKKEAKAAGTDGDKIFSINTYKTYRRECRAFAAYVMQEHPNCTSLNKAKKYASEWIQLRIDQGCSAWTVQTEVMALQKMYGEKVAQDVDVPERRRENITRSRVERVRDGHFSKSNNDELIRFCKGTGLRRSELEKLVGRDLIHRDRIEKEISRLESMAERTPRDEKRLVFLKDTRLFKEDYFLYVKGKGGRERLSPIIGKDAPQIIERIQNTPEKERVWQYVHSCADVHSYRADYATAIYKAAARPIDQIPFDRVNQGSGKAYQSEVYNCRGDEKGKRLDKAAMLTCSKALGHNRVCVVADHYLRGL